MTSTSPYACPGCASGPFEVAADITDWGSGAEDLDVLLVVGHADGTVTADPFPSQGADTDMFMHARCLACGLSLVNESGETRLRRADAKQVEPDGWADGGSPDADLTDAQHAALFDLTTRLLHAVPTGPAPLAASL